MAKETSETYEQGTGRLIASKERDTSPVEDKERAQAERRHNLFTELDDIQRRLEKVEGKS